MARRPQLWHKFDMNTKILRISPNRSAAFIALFTVWMAGCSAPSDDGGNGGGGGDGGDGSIVVAGDVQARNMALVGYHDLQARSAYQPVVHAYGDRRILFVGHHAGEAANPMTEQTQVNGLSILDVTDPASPVMLAHVPPTGEEASGTQHVQVCDGGVLPEGDPDRVYAVRTNGLLAYELLDVTDPANPAVISTIAETGDSSRPESSRGNRETHKIQWECETGVGYFNGTPEGWRVTRVLQAFDLSNPEAPPTHPGLRSGGLGTHGRRAHAGIFDFGVTPAVRAWELHVPRLRQRQ